MNLSHHAKQSLLLAALLLSLHPAHADIRTIEDAAAFDQAVSASGMDNFFGVAQDAASGSLVNRRTLLGETYRYVAEASSGGLLGAGSADEVWLTANVASDVITFSSFSAGITAFGGHFFGTDFNAQYLAGEVTLSVTDASGATFVRTLSAPTVDSFVGFLSSGPPIVSVSLSAPALPSGDSLWPTARQVVLGQAVSAVPEPASVSLLALGLGALAVAWRRKRA